ncbi:MAG TPA: TIR domain-containing protein [Myxococcaceae bacterium]|nr:TIR domain-containing protein [Myxococcaceae bacterium]
MAPKKAVAALTSFRKRINDAAEAARPPLTLRFQVDTRKQSPPDERECWFTGPDPAIASATRWSEQVTGDVVGKPLVRQRGIATTGSALASGKRLVRFFVSYAHADRKLADSLLAELQKQCASAARYEYEVWSDGRIPVGESWRARIQRGLAECDFGLLLVSPSFLGSKFILSQELPHFVGERSARPVLPVGLAKVDLEEHDLRGLEAHQVFLMRGGRAYGELEGTRSKSEYAHELFLRIQERMDGYFGGTEERDLDEVVPIPQRTEHFQRTKGISIALRDLEREERPVPDQARDALSEIEAWAVKDDSPPFFALLGEYGIGKTTTLKQLTRDLLERRKVGEDLPLPVYVDLRDYVPATKDAVPTVEELLATVIQRSWKVRDRSVTAEAVLRLVREEGALILFDGLDERIVHLSPDRAREFIRTLWAVLPDATRPADALQPGKRRGKLLISCRSHYFRDVWSQNSMLVGEDREGLDRSRFPAFCLVPFSEEQIRGYLTSLLGDRRHADAVFELIASIHNLPDLAGRPYLLKLITEQISQLEDLKVRGQQVNASRLYDLVVRSWLNRDDGKHQLDPAHKRRLMEALAAALWRSGSKEWDADRLEEWFDDYLNANPALAGAYANKDRAVLKEDLRTATFILRPDTEQQRFRFAHTSLQEYFLASHLARALADGRDEAFDLPMVSDETLDFLSQILSLDSPASALRTMERILGGEHVGAALIAFKYWLRTQGTGGPAPLPARVKLASANLEEWTIFSPDGKAPLNLRGADLSNAKLNRARLQNVDLSEANLDGLEARQSLFLRVNASRVSARRADLAGLRWRGGSLRSADLTGAQTTGCHLIAFDQPDAGLPAELPSSHPNSSDRGALTMPVGHSSSASACAWSPDGQRLLSGSYDRSLKVWDAASGECLLTLSGHSSPVRACAWSPDGQHLLSGSDDRSLKVWDAASGECLLTLSGHSNPVRACAWSPDGQRLLSGSDDRSLKVWDAASGECLLTLSGHSRSVTACAWGSDGKRFLSGSHDRSLKVWDATSGKCLLTLSGHSSLVSACAWSPDCKRLLSGSDDGSLRVWDAASGECLLILLGHSSSVSACAWSPDGQHLLSGSPDRSLKVWDAATGECLTLSGHSNWVTACAWSPDGKRLLSGSRDYSVRVWDADSGECLLTLLGQFNPASACAWSPDGQHLLSGSYNRSLKVWGADSGECLLTLSGHSDSVLACAWSPDGKHFLSGSYDRSLKVWDAASGECLLTLSGHSNPVRACAWNPDGQRLLSGSDDRSLKVWDAASGECLLTLSGHSNPVLACAWSSDGRHLLSSSDDHSLKVWDAASGECLLTLSGHSNPVWACAWSPDGQRLLSGSDDGSLNVWDAASGECLLTLSGHSNPVRVCAWSPDGQRLLSGSFDNSLKVWDAASGECLLTLSGHSNSVRACAWSPDSQRLLSGSFDNSLKVWDAASGECIWTGYLFPQGQTASIDEVHQRVLHASPEAWRWLNWRMTDPATGRIRLLPYEAFAKFPPQNARPTLPPRNVSSMY